MADFNVLKATIASRIPDNTDQLIDAADVRDSFLDSLDEVNAKKQDKLESGVNIKTINGESLLGSGDIPLAGATEWGDITGDLEDQTDLKDALDAKQDAIANLATIESGAAAGATAVQPGDLATVATSGQYSDLTGTPSLATVATTGDYDDLLDKPTIPAAPGTLDTDNATAQAVNSSEALSGTVKLHKVSKTGDYGDLLNKPTIPAAQVQADWNEADNTKADYIKNKPTIPAAQVNSDWNAVSGVAQILNKPTIPAAPGTLNTDNTGAQSVSSSEALSGTVKLHKISKTGSYADLNNKPTIPSISLNGSTTTTPSFYAPTGAGTLGQVLTSNGSGAPTWQAAPVGDVTVGGTSVVSGGVAAVPAIPSAPGTLDTTATTAQATSANEALSGSVTLHKVAKTGTYSDLIGTPAIPTVPTISTDVATDKASNDKTTGAKAVYDFVKPATGSSQPVGGMLPGVLYKLGTLTGSVTITLAAAADSSVANEYMFTFTAGSTAPTITWPTGTKWAGNCVENGAPVITGGNSYEVSILDGKGLIAEWEA